MDHLKALAIKFAIIAVALYSILGIFYTASVGEIFLISLIVTGAAYLIGDLFILPRFGNLTATIADFGLSFVAVWYLSTLFFGADTAILTAAGLTSLFIAFGEAIFHVYMQRSVLDLDNEENDRTAVKEGDFQTEFAEEENEEDVMTLEKDQENKKE